MINTAIIGTGYVGLVTGACLASQGMHVYCYDTDSEKIQKLADGILPIYEPELDDLVRKCVKDGNLEFITDMGKAVKNAGILFITVNTPSLDNFTCDLSHVFDAAKSIAESMNDYKIIVNKSTVPIGTGSKVKQVVRETLAGLGKNIGFDVVSNPEFLKEGSAVHDFFHSDRIIIGSDNADAAGKVKEVYKDLILNGIPVVNTNIKTAEMIKYASNAFLASKISFINEIAAICERCGADITTVAKGMGMDQRIGGQFLKPGPGFGGSCFPKDVKALAGIALQHGLCPVMLKGILKVNARQIDVMLRKIHKAVGKNLEGKTITILGLSFKPGTDDIRESPSVSIIERLLLKKVNVKVTDPKAMENLSKNRPDLNVSYCGDVSSACAGSDCIVLATEWEEFTRLDFNELKEIVKKPVFLDLRNVYTPSYVKSFGFYYEGVGRS